MKKLLFCSIIIILAGCGSEIKTVRETYIGGRRIIQAKKEEAKKDRKEYEEALKSRPDLTFEQFLQEKGKLDKQIED